MSGGRTGRPLRVWVIRDDKPGHYHQSEGVLEGLRRLCGAVESLEIEVAIRNKPSRTLLRRLLDGFPGYFRRRESLRLLPLFYRPFELPESPPDLILSTGGNTANLNAWLAGVYGVKNLLVGRLRGIREEHFGAILTVIDFGYSNNVVLETAPNTITGERLREEAEAFARRKGLDPAGHYRTLMIGGDGSGYRFDRDYYDRLADYVLATGAREGVRWLVSTSRRTPPEMEERLRERLEEACASFVAYHRNPERVTLAFFGLSREILVTEESSTMIGEAVASRRPVVTVGISSARPDANYRATLAKFEEAGRIRRVEINELQGVRIDRGDFRLLERFSPEEIAEKLAVPLGDLCGKNGKRGES
jgi:mitochondrial fission protein ELM1